MDSLARRGGLRRYKALGNSVAVPCVAYVLRGIVLACGDADNNVNERNSTEL